MRKIALVALVLCVGTLAAGSACGGDACQTLADEFAACGGPTGTTSTGTSSDGGPVCSDKEKRQAQCVLDAKVDLCKIKSKTATDADTQAYQACYAK